MARLLHIINPVNAPHNKELMEAQPIVFESIRRAKEYGKADVQLCTVQYPEDRAIIPGWFTMLPDLERSVHDVGAFPDKKKLPLIRDILESAYRVPSEYMIFSNADIAIMPFFYEAVEAIISEGYDSFIINRRRISTEYRTPGQLDLMYSEAGRDHLGYDCFVIRRDLYPKFILGDMCVGIPLAWNEVAHNLFCFSEKFRLFTKKHLTFHAGMELYKAWGSPELEAHNKKEFLKVVKALQPHYRIGNIPGSGLSFFKRHFKWLMNPTFHYPVMLKADLEQWKSPRPDYREELPADGRNKYLERLIRYVNFD